MEGVGEETTNLLSALLINAGEGQVGVWLKEGRSEWEGREKGRLFVGIDLCWGGGRTPAAPQCPEGEGAKRGEGAPGETRGQSSPAAGRTPLSRSVKLNKEGICVFLTSAEYLIHKRMYNSLWVFLKTYFIM